LLAYVERAGRYAAGDEKRIVIMRATTRVLRSPIRNFGTTAAIGESELGKEGETFMRWTTKLVTIVAAVALSAAVATGARAHGGGGGHGGGGFGGGGHGGFGGHGFGAHGFAGHGFDGRGFGGRNFDGRGFAGARFGHCDHGRFGRFDHDRVGFRRHFFFAGVGPGFYDWPYDDYGYGSCRVPTRNGWVWAC